MSACFLHTLFNALSGGYLVANYALKYPTSGVNALVLISPVGLPDHPVPIKKKSYSFRAFLAGWNSNFTPQRVIRFMPKIALSSHITSTFSSALTKDQIQQLTDYLYCTNTGPISGEYAMNSLLVPIATSKPKDVYARKPLRQELCKLPPQFPVLVFFGDKDWMAFDEIESYVKEWNQKGLDVNLRILPKAGHHLYIDNADRFHSDLKAWLSGERNNTPMP